MSRRVDSKQIKTKVVVKKMIEERTKDELRDRSRHTNGSDSSRHKRRRSSSVDGRGRKSKDNSVVSHAYSSSDESLDDSKRKLHHSRKRKSPSPVRSRKSMVKNLRESYNVDHLPEADKFRGLPIESTLSAGILPILLLRLPGGGQDRDHHFVGDNDSKVRVELMRIKPAKFLC